LLGEDSCHGIFPSPGIQEGAGVVSFLDAKMNYFSWNTNKGKTSNIQHIQ